MRVIVGNDPATASRHASDRDRLRIMVALRCSAVRVHGRHQSFFFSSSTPVSRSLVDLCEHCTRGSHLARKRSPQTQSFVLLRPPLLASVPLPASLLSRVDVRKLDRSKGAQASRSTSSTVLSGCKKLLHPNKEMRRGWRCRQRSPKWRSLFGRFQNQVQAFAGSRYVRRA